MAIRLNKVIRELNIGLQTAVEFLQKKSNLGEVESNLNFKLNDDQYAALVEEFKSDKKLSMRVLKTEIWAITKLIHIARANCPDEELELRRELRQSFLG